MRASWSQTIHRQQQPELEPGHQTNWCRRPELEQALSQRDLQLPEPPEPARRTQTHRPRVPGPPEPGRGRQIRTPRRPEPDSWPVPPELLRGLGSRRRIRPLPGPVLVLHRRLGRVPRRQRRNHRRLARGQHLPRRPPERELRS